MRLPLLIALAVGAILTIFATTPPWPRDAGASAAQFSSGRAMRDVAEIARAPHPTGSAELVRVRGYLAQRMARLGMTVSTSESRLEGKGLERLNRWSGRQDRDVPLVNLIGVLPGRDPALPAVLLMAHYDTVWGSPGASDDSAGVAASLEIVRALRTGGQPPRDVIVLLTDGEELGLEGAKVFFAAHPLRQRIGAIVNMEARGGGGRASLFQTARENGPAMALYAAHVSRPAASSLAAFIYSVLPNDTDLTPALQGPYLAYNFAFIGRSGLYHSPLATPDRLDEGSLQDMGQQALDLTRALTAAAPLPVKGPDVVFFDVFGLFTALWPAWLGWPMLAVAVAGLAFAVRRGGTAGLVEGLGRMLGLILFAAALFYALNWISTGGGRGEYYDRLAAIPRLEVMVLLGSLAAFLLLFGKRAVSPGLTAGASMPLLVLGIAGQWLAPTAAFVVVVPVLLIALALVWSRPWPQAGVAALVVGYMGALGHQLMQGVGPDMPMAAALPLALGSAAVLPLWSGLSTKTARLGIAIALGLSVATALWVQLDAPAETRAVYAKPAG